jgi:hypothetical protein
MKKTMGFWLMLAFVGMLMLPSLSSASPILKLVYGSDTAIFTNDDGIFNLDQAFGRFTVQVNGLATPNGLSLIGHASSWDDGVYPLSPLQISLFEDNYIGGTPRPVNIAFELGTDRQGTYVAKLDSTTLATMNSTNSDSFFVTPPPSFSLEQIVSLSGDPGEYWFTASLGATPNPEPSSLLLLGSGLIGAAAIFRRKF